MEPATPTRPRRRLDRRGIVVPLCGFDDRIPSYIELATRFAELEAVAQLVANEEARK
jgi:hypothetical protein